MTHLSILGGRARFPEGQDMFQNSFPGFTGGGLFGNSFFSNESFGDSG